MTGSVAGIDWASEKHDLLIADAAGERLLAETFAHDEHGITAVCDALAAAADRAGVGLDLQQIHGVATFLRGPKRMFSMTSDLARELPAPKVMNDELKRLAAELGRRGVIEPAGERPPGWVSRHAGASAT